MFGRYPIKTVRRIIFTIALALLALMTSVVFSTQRFEPINELYVYGTVFQIWVQCSGRRGNVSTTTELLSGRYSNGRVWVEYLAAHLPLVQSNQQFCLWRRYH